MQRNEAVQTDGKASLAEKLRRVMLSEKSTPAEQLEAANKLLDMAYGSMESCYRNEVVGNCVEEG